MSLDLIGKTLARYKILSLLGEGGMGSVFKAFDLTLQRDVAIKVMHPHFARRSDFQERFLQEARAAAHLSHPGIVQVHDFSRQAEMLYIVMAFIPGPNLAQMLQDMRTQGIWMRLSEGIQIVRLVAQALDYAHSQGVLHRDVKPGNIMISPTPADGLPFRPILTDLGLAKLVEGGISTMDASSMGTPAYMSPEQALGKPAEARSDVYSLGVLLYELSTTQLPFTVKNLNEAIFFHTQQAPPPPRSIRPDLPEKVEQVILRAMEKEPAARYQSAGDFAKALEESLPLVTKVANLFPALENAVSLITQYQKSVVEERGPSVFKEIGLPPDHSQDQIMVLPGGKTPFAVQVNPAGMTIGRDADNEIVLDDGDVSRHHARIETDGARFTVIDLNSTNGTYLGSSRLLPGVPEYWPPDQPLRVGKSFLRLAPAKGSAATRLQGGATRRAASTAFLTRGTGQVAIQVPDGEIQVEPGGSATLPVTLLNQGDLVDHFTVSVEGIPPAWVAIPEPSVQLMNGEQREVQVSFRPPRRPDSRSRRYPISVRVASRSYPDQSVEARGALTVARYTKFSLQLHPQKIRSDQIARLTIKNEGNSQETFQVSMEDPGDELEINPRQAQVTVPEGGEQSVELRAAPRRRTLIGGEETRPFTARVSLAGSEAQAAQGTLVSKAMIPRSVFGMLLTLLGICAAITCAAAGYVAMRPDPTPTPTLVAVLPTTAVPTDTLTPSPTITLTPEPNYAGITLTALVDQLTAQAAGTQTAMVATLTQAAGDAAQQTANAQHMAHQATEAAQQAAQQTSQAQAAATAAAQDAATAAAQQTAHANIFREGDAQLPISAGDSGRTIDLDSGNLIPLGTSLPSGDGDLTVIQTIHAVWLQAGRELNEDSTRSNAQFLRVSDRPMGLSGCTTARATPTVDSEVFLVYDSNVFVGSFVCMRTTSGRLAEFKVVSFDFDTREMKIDYIVWRQ